MRLRYSYPMKQFSDSVLHRLGTIGYADLSKTFALGVPSKRTVRRNSSPSLDSEWAVFPELVEIFQARVEATNAFKMNPDTGSDYFALFDASYLSPRLEYLPDGTFVGPATFTTFERFGRTVYDSLAKQLCVIILRSPTTMVSQIVGWYPQQTTIAADFAHRVIGVVKAIVDMAPTLNCTGIGTDREAAMPKGMKVLTPLKMSELNKPVHVSQRLWDKVVAAVGDEACCGVNPYSTGDRIMLYFFCVKHA